MSTERLSRRTPNGERRLFFDNYAYQKLSNGFYAGNELPDGLGRQTSSWIDLMSRSGEQNAHDAVVWFVCGVEARECAGILASALLIVVWGRTSSPKLRIDDLA